MATGKALGDQPDAAYEKAFVTEALRAFDSYSERAAVQAGGASLSFSPEKRAAILKMYEDASLNVSKGFDSVMKRYASSSEDRKRKIAALYAAVQKEKK